MKIRESLVARPDVAEEEIELVIERAAKLQQQAQQEARGVSKGEIKDIAEELEINPAFVEEALSQLREDQKRAKEEEKRQALEAEKRLAERKRTLRRVGMLAVGAGAFLLVLLFLGALLGQNGVKKAQNRAEAAQVKLNTVLERQAALLPQLIALSGGETKELLALKKSLNETKKLEKRLLLHQELSDVLAKTLASLPPQQGNEQTRLSLQYEITGSQSRITTEKRRYDEAVVAWKAEANSLLGSLAVRFGLADAPAAP